MLLLISDPLGSAATIQHPEEMRGPYFPVSSQPGFIDFMHIFQRRHNHLQETSTRIPSSIFQRSTLKDGSCTLQNDGPEVRKADAEPSVEKSSKICRLREANPLLTGILEGNEVTLQYLAGAPAVGNPCTSVRLRSDDGPSANGILSEKQTAAMDSSSCGQIRAAGRAPSAHYQPNALRPSPSAAPAAYKSSEILPSNGPAGRSNAEIVDLIKEKIASLKERRLRSDHSRPNSTSAPCHPTTAPSDKRDGTVHRFSRSPTEQSATAAGQTSGVDSLTRAQETAELPPRSDKKGNESASLKHPNGTTTSAVQRCPNVTVGQSARAGVEMPRQTSDGGKLVCDNHTSSSGKVAKHVLPSVNMNSITHYSLSALQDLAASLDNVATDEEMGNISEILLNKYWNGDKGNIRDFESTEYPRIMNEVAATCIRHEEESPVVISAPPRNSPSPLEDQTPWINTGKKYPSSHSGQETSSIPKHTAADTHSGSHMNNQEINSSREGTFSLSVLKDPQYDDVIDTEDPGEPPGKQAQAKPMPKPLQKCCCPYYVETETDFVQVPCPKCESENVLRDAAVHQTDESQCLSSDDEMDDWLVIPLKVLHVTMDVQAEPDDADDEGEQIVTSSPVSVSPPLAVEDTAQSTGTQPGRVPHVPPEGGMLEMDTDSPNSTEHPSGESDGSCETEDSCDYVRTEGRNYLTVSRQAWRKLSSPSPSKQGDRRARLQNHKRRRQKALAQKDTADPDSDLEDGNDSRTKTSRKRRKAVSSCSEDTDAAPRRLHKRPSDQDCDAAVEKSSRQQKSEELTERRTERHPVTETEDSCDDARYNKRSTSSTNSGGESSVREKKEPKKARQPFKLHPRPKSQVGQTKEGQAASSEPPQIKKTKQGLKVMTAEGQVGPARLKTDRRTASKRSSLNLKPKGRTIKKARRASRIYSDSSEAEEEPGAVSDVSDRLNVNKHRSSGQRLGAKAKSDHGPRRTGSPTTADRRKSDRPEKDHVNKKKKTRRLSETEDSEDSFSNSPDSSKLKPLQRRPDKPPPCPSSASPPPSGSIVKRLYVQGSPQASKRLRLSKQFPLQTQSAEGRPQAPASTAKKAESRKWQPSHGKIAPKPKPLSSSGPKRYVPAPRPQLFHSFSHPPSSDGENPPAHSSAWEKVKGIWKDRFYPIPSHKKASHGAEAAADPPPEAEPEPGTSSSSSRIRRRRHSCSKSETPLMKKSKSEAKERTRDINYNPQRRPSHAVSDHYKWKDRSDGRETEGSWRPRRRSPSPELDWD
ncbi:uncharacterized protein LOC115404537 isoform X2 [Salarias fasciatus]|uniref:uncharacterized protein LOC115404537 isoform X2 n=1 Tax=Salarias fasciatus TaxID=181472 RepID=UPI0011765842|nr:uncharacterized protein LOC115404537 isoform X2 [Salarias fasciatus]